MRKRKKKVKKRIGGRKKRKKDRSSYHLPHSRVPKEKEKIGTNSKYTISTSTRGKKTEKKYGKSGAKSSTSTFLAPIHPGEIKKGRRRKRRIPSRCLFFSDLCGRKGVGKGERKEVVLSSLSSPLSPRRHGLRRRNANSEEGGKERVSLLPSMKGASTEKKKLKKGARTRRIPPFSSYTFKIAQSP